MKVRQVLGWVIGTLPLTVGPVIFGLVTGYWFFAQLIGIFVLIYIFVLLGLLVYGDNKQKEE